MKAFICVAALALVGMTARAEAQNASMRTFLLCTMRAENLLDDHISDAQTIALALTERCFLEYAAVAAAFEPTDSPHARALVIEQRNSREAKVDASLETVLSMRRGYVLNPNPDDGPLMVLPPANR
jgi:hypothetical protein